MHKIKFGIAGFYGRLAQAIYKASVNSSEVIFTRGLVRSIREDSELYITTLADDFFKGIDVVIIAITSDGIDELIKKAVFYKKPTIVATTGIKDLEVLKEAGNHIPIMYAPNLSIAVATMNHIVKIAQNLLEGFDIDIIESHHKHKKDSPSGTALMLNKTLDDKANIYSLRRGECTGTHQVIFTSGVEELAITHNAFSREAFAQGAMASISWIYNKLPGFYTMHDLIIGRFK